MESVLEEIVIIGGGIIGCSTAYYLTETQAFKDKHINVTIIEADRIAAAASGYAGGFLARDWHGPANAELGRLSFTCHRDLSEKHDGARRWGYRTTTSMSFTARESQLDGHLGKEESNWLQGIGGIRQREGVGQDLDGSLPHDFDWIDGRHITGISQMDSATAQINPLRMTRFLCQESERRGTKMIQGTAAEIVRHGNGSMGIGLQDGRVIPYHKLLLAAGPWSGHLHDMLFPTSPKLPISSFAGTSLLLQSKKSSLSPYAAFGAVTLADGRAVEIEFFGREDGQIWIGGINDHSSLPAASVGIEPRPADVATLTRISALLFPDARVNRVSKCYRPINVSNAREKDVPIMRQMQEGLFVCAGHSVWGISLGPGSGFVMSNLLTQPP